MMYNYKLLFTNNVFNIQNMKLNTTMYFNHLKNVALSNEFLKDSLLMQYANKNLNILKKEDRQNFLISFLSKNMKMMSIEII